MKKAARESLGEAGRGWRRWLNRLMWIRYTVFLDEAKQAFRRQVTLPPRIAYEVRMETPDERRRRRKAEAEKAAAEMAAREKARKRRRYYVDPQTGHICPESAFPLICGQDK